MMKRSHVPPPQASEDSSDEQPKSFANQQWQRAAGLFKANPSLVTYNVLCMALKHRPPLSIIKYMLKINRKAAGIPKEGPTPLQVAIQHSCSNEVVRELIEACPFQLVATNPGSHLEPLSYVKRFRPEEKELIKLLSRPLNDWVEDVVEKSQTDDCDDDREGVEDDKTTAATNKARGISFHYKKPSTKPTVVTPSPRRDGPPPFGGLCVGPAPFSATTAAAPTTEPAMTTPVSLPQHQYQQPPLQFTIMDRQELANVKQLCIAVVKGHRRLSRELKALQAKDDADMLEKLQIQNDKAFKTQLIALDMKEVAMRSHLKDVETRIEAKLQKLYVPNDPMEVLQQELKQTTKFVQEHLKQLQTRMQMMEEKVQDHADRMDQHVEHLWTQRSLFENEHEKMLPSMQIVSLEEESPATVSTSYSSSSLASEYGSSSSSSEFCASLPTPVVFCTPYTNNLLEKDEVRSLLSEDDLLVVKKRLLRQTRWWLVWKNFGGLF